MSRMELSERQLARPRAGVRLTARAFPPLSLSLGLDAPGRRQTPAWCTWCRRVCARSSSPPSGTCTPSSPRRASPYAAAWPWAPARCPGKRERKPHRLVSTSMISSGAQASSNTDTGCRGLVLYRPCEQWPTARTLAGQRQRDVPGSDPTWSRAASRTAPPSAPPPRARTAREPC